MASAVGHRPPGCLLLLPGDGGALASRLAEAAGLPASPQAARVAPAQDPFVDLLEVYRALDRPRSLERNSPHPAEPPSSSP